MGPAGSPRGTYVLQQRRIIMRRSLHLVPVLFLAYAAPLHAEGNGGLLSVNPGLAIWTVIIFAIVFAILAKFAFPQILGAVEAREKHIEELAAAAERDRAEAARLLEEARKQMDDTHAKVHQALAESRTA